MREAATEALVEHLRVLVVEDDPSIGSQMVRGLQAAGHEVSWVTSGREAIDARLSHVVLLDLGLPDVDGLSVCRTLRAASGVAIIVVTARGDEDERVSALDLGADDYLVKPFGIRELLARIRAVARRSMGIDDAVLRWGQITLDERARRVLVGGREVTLTGKEFEILNVLVRV